MVVAYANKGRGRQPGFGISRYSGKTAIYRLRITGAGNQKVVASWDNPHNIAANKRRIAKKCQG
jgi:hypothetical protein